jgi:hypothetical protein
MNATNNSLQQHINQSHTKSSCTTIKTHNARQKTDKTLIFLK